VNWNDIVSAVLIALGCFFFLAGTVGLLRFPDVFTRLHALTKADNVGLGLVALAAAFQVDNPVTLVKLFFIWGLVMVSSATISHLIARASLAQGRQPWEKRSST
jgi:multicomponent Na+:H+ antiporter subunit G